jgi:membrane-bound lytic murein transglycosylase D
MKGSSRLLIMAVSRILLTGALSGAILLTLTGCPSQQAANTVPPGAVAPATAAPASPADNTAATTAESTPSDRDQRIIAGVEDQYHSGLDAYQQGNLDTARQHFNRAVDQLLTCGVNLKTDAALRAEFDRIVDSVDTLEMDALKQGNGLTESEPSPVDVANNVTFPVNAKLEAQAAAEIKTTQSDLPLVMNDYVASYINFFENTKRGHDTIVASLERGGRYKAMIEGVLKKAGLPQDLYYQAVAESGFNPTAVNRSSGAGGMWQFMPFGNYGLVHNAWVDQRFDPVLATEAYTRLIKADYDQLGDWYLAMAAYDWGAGNVQRAVERTGYADFWQLYKLNNLPAETKNYVPIILAVTFMAKHPDQYGLSDLSLDPPLTYDTVQTNTEINLHLVADITGATVDQLETLNPSLLRGATPPDEAFTLRIPAGTKSIFQQDIALIPPDDRRDWRFHFVKPTDTLASIAHEYHVSEDELASVNQIDAPSDLAQRDAVVIPVARPSQPSLLRTLVYRVRRGDTLISIADRYGVSVLSLRRWNHLRSNFLRAGERLRVSAPVRAEMRDTTYSHEGTEYHRIERGETLGGIADRYHISVEDLRRWNHLHGNEIAAGHSLRVSPPHEHATLADPPAHRRDRASHQSSHAQHAATSHPRYYRVRRGDTIGGIASRFHVSIADLRRWNHLRGNEIRAGHSLRVSAPK